MSSHPIDEPDRPAQLLIFDGDDTLWETERLYDLARDLAAHVVRAAGFDPVLWTERQKQIDLVNVGEMGLSRERFPTSSVQAYEELARGEVDDATRQQVWDASASVFEMPAPIIPAVDRTLEELASGHRMVLLTKGDRDVQHARVHNFDLLDRFDAFLIVDAKTPETFRGLCTAFGFAPADAWSIGNSLPSDILPAHEAGLRTIWLDAHVWDHERRASEAPDSVVQLKEFRAVPLVLAGN